jgi:hypothetical protein
MLLAFVVVAVGVAVESLPALVVTVGGLTGTVADWISPNAVPPKFVDTTL